MKISEMCTCILFFIVPQIAMSDDNHSERETTVVRGIVVTGINDVLGSPVGPGPAIQLVGEYVPGGDEPLPVTPDTSEHAVLATRLNPILLSFVNLTPADFPEDIDNIPLHENPIPFLPTIFERAPAVPASFAQAGEPSRRVEDPITLGKWFGAKGKAYIHCSRERSQAFVYFSFRRLVPNGLYTLWAVPATPGGLPTAFGGVPNVFTADRRGSAIVSRKVAYCPTDGQLHDITAAYHSDGMIYGNFPDATLDGFPSGIVAHDHLVFPLL